MVVVGEEGGGEMSWEFFDDVLDFFVGFVFVFFGGGGGGGDGGVVGGGGGRIIRMTRRILLII